MPNTTLQITTLVQFIEKLSEPGNNAPDPYDLFEHQCSEDLRDQIYSLADPESPEPFRSAMINIGFVDY